MSTIRGLAGGVRVLMLGAAVLMAGGAARVSAQVVSTPQVDVSGLLGEAITRTQANSLQALAFTYDIASRTRNFNTQGKLLIDETGRYEVVFVEGLPYRRQVEQDGKPLSGKAAREEIERYRRAFDERSRMTLDQKRSYLRRKHHVDIPLPLIPTLFTSSMSGEEQVDGRGTFVIDCEPRADAHPSDEEERRAMRKRVRLWIDRDDRIVSHMEATLIEDDAGFDKGTTARIDFSEIEGVWLPVRSDVKFQARERLEKIRGETEETNSRFKKFRVDVRLLDGGEIAHDRGPTR